MAPKQTKPAARELIVDMARHLSTAEIAHATRKARRTYGESCQTWERGKSQMLEADPESLTNLISISNDLHYV